jgi:hypothetical protein
MNPRKCVRFNYIPHQTCNNVSFEKWKQEYELQLNNLYQIFREILNEKYENDIDLDSEKHYNKFCKMIFKSSSKYILN